MFGAPFSRGGNLNYIAHSPIIWVFTVWRSGSGADLYWVIRTNLEEWGAYFKEPRCRLARDLACAIWLENGMSPLRVFTLTSWFKRSSHQVICCAWVGVVPGEIKQAYGDWKRSSVDWGCNFQILWKFCRLPLLKGYNYMSRWIPGRKLS